MVQLYVVGKRKSMFYWHGMDILRNHCQAVLTLALVICLQLSMGRNQLVKGQRKRLLTSWELK